MAGVSNSSSQLQSVRLIVALHRGSKEPSLCLVMAWDQGVSRVEAVGQPAGVVFNFYYQYKLSPGEQKKKENQFYG